MSTAFLTKAKKLSAPPPGFRRVRKHLVIQKGDLWCRPTDNMWIETSVGHWGRDSDGHRFARLVAVPNKHRYRAHWLAQMKLQRRIEELEAAIRIHRSQKADDRCIEDDDRLYAVLGDGIKCDRRVGDKAAMLLNCARFIEKRCQGGGWPTYAELEAENAKLKVRGLNPSAAELVNAMRRAWVSEIVLRLKSNPDGVSYGPEHKYFLKVDVGAAKKQPSRPANSCTEIFSCWIDVLKRLKLYEPKA